MKKTIENIVRKGKKGIVGLGMIGMLGGCAEMYPVYSTIAATNPNPAVRAAAGVGAGYSLMDHDKEVAREGRTVVNVGNQYRSGPDENGIIWSHPDPQPQSQEQRDSVYSFEHINLDNGESEIEIVGDENAFNYFRNRHENNLIPKNGYLVLAKKNGNVYKQGKFWLEDNHPRFKWGKKEAE